MLATQGLHLWNILDSGAPIMLNELRWPHKLSVRTHGIVYGRVEWTYRSGAAQHIVGPDLAIVTRLAVASLRASHAPMPRLRLDRQTGQLSRWPAVKVPRRALFGRIDSWAIALGTVPL